MPLYKEFTTLLILNTNASVNKLLINCSLYENLVEISKLIVFLMNQHSS